MGQNSIWILAIEYENMKYLKRGQDSEKVKIPQNGQIPSVSMSIHEGWISSLQVAFMPSHCAMSTNTSSNAKSEWMNTSKRSYIIAVTQLVSVLHSASFMYNCFL